MIGGTVGEVVASKNPKFSAGDKVVGMFGWREMGVSDGTGIQKVDTTHIPLSAYLGSVGMPGVTGWYGLNQIIKPKAGQTVVVSAASGAVGSVVGQLAKLKGCRAVGVAGGKDKCDYVVNELGFDACVDYKAAKDAKELYMMLKEATPDGIDGYFENVGGDVLDVVLSRMNPFGRIAVCGMIAGYDGQPLPLKNPQLIHGLAPDGGGLHRLRAHGVLAAGAAGMGAGVAGARSSSARPWRRAWPARRRPSWACSRARTSASSWSSWCKPARRGRAARMPAQEAVHAARTTRGDTL